MEWPDASRSRGAIPDDARVSAFAKFGCGAGGARQGLDVRVQPGAYGRRKTLARAARGLVQRLRWHGAARARGWRRGRHAHAGPRDLALAVWSLLAREDRSSGDSPVAAVRQVFRSRADADERVDHHRQTDDHTSSP